MAKSNVRKFVVFILLIAISVSLCSCSIPQPKPKDGIWYCEELRLEIDFFVFNQQHTAYCAKMRNPDGTTQDVLCLFDFGSLILISSLDHREDYLIGHFQYKKETWFREESFTVTTMDGEHTYIFERIDD